MDKYVLKNISSNNSVLSNEKLYFISSYVFQGELYSVGTNILAEAKIYKRKPKDKACSNGYFEPLSIELEFDNKTSNIKE